MRTRTLVFILPSVLVVLLISSCATTSKMLIQSAENGDYAEVKRLIEEGEDVNAVSFWRGYTALMSASEKGHVEVATLLIDKGADVNAQNGDGLTALMIASRYGQTEIAKLLIEEGANVNAQGSREFNGWTALMYASQYGQTEVTKLLIEEGADVNAMSTNRGYQVAYRGGSGCERYVYNNYVWLCIRKRLYIIWGLYSINGGIGNGIYRYCQAAHKGGSGC